MHFFQFPPFRKWDYLIKGLICTTCIKICIHVSRYFTPVQVLLNFVVFSAVLVENMWNLKFLIFCDIFKYRLYEWFLSTFFGLHCFSTDQRINMTLFRHQIFEISNIFIFTIFSNNSWYSHQIHTSVALLVKRDDETH